MKILLAMNLPYFPVFGGANKNNRYLAEALAQKGHAVRAVVPALSTPSRLTHEEFLSELMAQAIAVTSTAVIDSFRLHGVEVHAVVDPAHLRAHLLSQIQDFEPDWIFVASEEPAQNLLEATVTASPSRVVYLAQTPSFFPFGPQAFYPSPQRTKLFEQARAIVASSKFIADYIRQWSNLDPTVIYMPVYGSGPFPHFGRFDEGFVTMVNPCRLKGISIFLALARALPEVPFAAVPTWGTTDADLVVLQGLPNVQILEPRHDFDQILSKTRVLLMPSLWLENFPLTVIEAMLRGIPVVSSDVGGIPEVKLGTDFVLPVRPIERFLDRLDQNMLPVPVVPEQDIAPWYDTFRRLLSDHALYERQSAAARHAALQFVSGLSVAPLEELLLRLGSRPGAAQAVAKPRQPDSGGTTAKQDSNFARAAGLSAEQRALLMLRLWKKANQRVEQESAVPTITRAAREAPLPLSYAQQRLWFLQQLQPASPAYALPLALRLDGPLDLAALRHSFTVLVARHEILRTTFPLHADQPVQQIAPPRPVPLPLIDLQALPPTAHRPSADTLTAADARRPFDLAHGPLLRVLLLRLAPDLHILMLNLHHIITDGWSLGLLVREVLALYAAACDQRRPDLPDLPIQYADYAVWQRAWLQGSGVRGQGSARQGDKETRRQGDGEQRGSDSQSPIPNPQSPVPDLPSQPAPCATLVPHPSPPPALRLSPIQEQLAYWKTQLAELPALELPTDYPRGPEPTFAGDSHALALPKGLNAALNVLSQREGTTLFMTMLAAWLALLHRYSGQADLAVGTPIANRTHAATERLIGFFVNTLVLRADLSGNLSFRALLARVRQVCLDAYAHQDLPFERLVEALTPARDPSRHPLFDVLFELQPATLAPLELSQLRVRPQAVANQTAKFDLSLALDETPEGLIGAFEYRTDLFASATIARMAAHFQTLLEGIIAQPEQRLADLPLLPDAERNRVLAEFNATGASFRLDRFTHQVFEDRAAQTPDALAALCGAEQITYATLNRRANQLAHWLCRQRLGYSAHVGVLGSRSIDMLTVLLATLKAGCVYVPLDPAHPDARLTSILADSGIRLIATQAALLDRARTLIGSLAAPPLVFCWDAAPTLHARPGDRAWADQSGANIPGTPDPRDLANIFYTSGSTGVPKGAMVEQIGMLNHLWAKIDRLGLDARSSVAQTASHCFDISIWQFLAPLLAGGRVVIYDDDIVLDPLRFLQAIQRDHITVVETVPTHLTALLETIATRQHGAKEITLPALTYLISNAETLPVPLCRQWLEGFPHVPLINTYGATECSDDTTHYLLRTPSAEHAHRVPVGSPIPGFKIYVLDSQLRPLPIGCIGQIAMAGVGVGRGYQGDPAKTARVFVPIPHPPAPGCTSPAIRAVGRTMGCWSSSAGWMGR